jgi:hypothetical protein
MGRMNKEKSNLELNEEADFDKAVAKEKAKRDKILWRYEVPESLSLEDALKTLTKAELDDIRYNLCVRGASTLKKQDLAKTLAGEIVEFAKRWLVTIGIEQYNIITHLSRKNGVSTVLDTEDMRFDYMRSMGMLFSGTQEGKKAWYLPNEILNVYARLCGEEYRRAISFNNEVAHIATGLLYYYGFMQADKLYEMTKEKLSDGGDLSLVDFMGIMVNESCWDGLVFTTDDGMGLYYYSVFDVEALVDKQAENSAVSYHEFSYDELYAAGEREFVHVTDEYKALALVLRDEMGLDEKTASETAANVAVMLQNGESINDLFGYFQQCFVIPSREAAGRLSECVEKLRRVMPAWELKGHSPESMNCINDKGFHMQTTKHNVIKFVPRSSSVGRNDPCPCGSGKKYKKCCLGKEY